MAQIYIYNINPPIQLVNTTIGIISGAKESGATEAKLVPKMMARLIVCLVSGTGLLL